MMRSLYSGISGLRNHQTRMDVIGNNIANVNTIGYKGARTVFQDVFSQTAQSGSSNQALNFGMGGTNPIQIGLGVRLSTIDVLHGPAPMQRTDRALDMMINDDGYFVVGMPNPLHPAPFGAVEDIMDDDTIYINEDTGEIIPKFTYLYTRAGDFKMDNDGYLVTSHGYYVLGYNVLPFTFDPEAGDAGEFSDPLTEEEFADAMERGDAIFWRSELTHWLYVHKDLEPGEDPEWPRPEPKAIKMADDQVGFAVDNNGMINIIEGNRRRPIAQLTIGMFANPEGLEKVGNSLYREGNSSGSANLTIAGNMGAGTVSGGGLEMSNVDLASEFTDMIVTQRGFQANSRIITVSDTMLEELVNLKR